jgi:hypothetical protein
MMSHYEGLPIYRAAADRVVVLDLAARDFSRFHKYLLGMEQVVVVALMV